MKGIQLFTLTIPDSHLDNTGSRRTPIADIRRKFSTPSHNYTGLSKLCFEAKQKRKN